MKKIASILLLILFLFNTIGYKLFISYMESKADKTFSERLDDGYYSDDDLVAVKVPINLPYQSNWSNYERVNGQVELGGQVYQYVKCKVYNDTMIYLCIRHDAKTIMQQKAHDYLGKVNDVPGSGNAKKAGVLKQLFSDCNIVSASNSFSLFSVYPGYNLYRNTLMPDLYISMQGRPPQPVA